MKQKYNYTKAQEEKIIHNAKSVLTLVFVLLTIALAMGGGILFAAYPLYGSGVVSIVIVGYVFRTFYRATIVVNHRKKVSLQDDNIVKQDTEE